MVYWFGLLLSRKFGGVVSCIALDGYGCLGCGSDGECWWFVYVTRELVVCICDVGYEGKSDFIHREMIECKTYVSWRLIRDSCACELICLKCDSLIPCEVLYK